MSAALRVRDHNGVVLDYGDPAACHPFHSEQQIYPADSERMTVLAAEGEVRILTIMVEYLQVSEIGRTRFLDALQVIQRALDVKRPKLGLAHGR